jgi:hypothetical protein
MEAPVKTFCVVYDLNRAKDYSRVERLLSSWGARRGTTTTTWYLTGGPYDTATSMKAALQPYVDGDDDLEVIACTESTDAAFAPERPYRAISERMARLAMESRLGMRRSSIADAVLEDLGDIAHAPRRPRIARDIDSVSPLADVLGDLSDIGLLPNR